MGLGLTGMNVRVQNLEDVFRLRFVSISYRV